MAFENDDAVCPFVWDFLLTQDVMFLIKFDNQWGRQPNVKMSLSLRSIIFRNSLVLFSLSVVTDLILGNTFKNCLKTLYSSTLSCEFTPISTSLTGNDLDVQIAKPSILLMLVTMSISKHGLGSLIFRSLLSHHLN